MIAAYNKTQVPITEVHTVENVLLFRNEKGSYVLTYPIDNFFWTKQAAEKNEKGVKATSFEGWKGALDFRNIFRPGYKKAQ